MKFTRSRIPARIEPKNTPRRLANAARAIERQRQSWGLFPELAPQETPQQRLDRMDAHLAAVLRRLRSLEARCWREGRRFLRTRTPEERAAFLREYHRLMEKFPSIGTGAYFADMVRGHFGAEAYDAARK